ncbi:MAG: hypothetical protein JRN67_12005 [Nitrososphaerota archaeon]|nr:hypothetical protein [Nitrososphaerota archaeon]
MVRFKELGYDSETDYLSDFRKTLLKTTYTYEYFVDWKKVEANVRQYRVEVAMLNSLALAGSPAERKNLLRELLAEHPKILAAIPILLAVRDSDVEIADLMQQIIYKRFRFAPQLLTPEELDDMLMFCEKTGVVDLFGEIKDAQSYAMGVEVGLDSNARKNRSGEVFKNLVDHLLTVAETKLSKFGLAFTHIPEVRLVDLGISKAEKKKVDFMIYESGKPVAACEANVYDVQGSKPTEIIRAYTHLDKRFIGRKQCSLERNRKRAVQVVVIVTASHKDNPISLQALSW